ncbi:hypothetical protein DY000_02037360 [Brassica cretica]|uniref:AT-hook motif nuclear-localized protein n=1 Tax=Brassica cretica TaxID=69181 RepID=A0ABQ7B609_BRACR|nr:hypothetical protein DY000_02037360 [Brassica cretica]
MKLRRRELQVVKAGWIVSMVILLKVITFALCIKQSPFSSSNPLSLSLSHQLREGNDRVLRGRRCRLKVEEEAHEETEEEAQEDETAIQVVCASMPIHKSLNLYVLCHYIYVGIIVCRTWTKNGRFSVHSSIRQREHMRRDAMAGLHVLRLMPEPTAVALLSQEVKEEEGSPLSGSFPGSGQAAGQLHPGGYSLGPKAQYPLLVTGMSSSPPAGVEPGSMTIGPQGSNQ